MIIKNNNLINYVNYYFIIIVPEKPIWGGSIKYVCMYVCMTSYTTILLKTVFFQSESFALTKG